MKFLYSRVKILIIKRYISKPHESTKSLLNLRNIVLAISLVSTIACSLFKLTSTPFTQFIPSSATSPTITRHIIQKPILIPSKTNTPNFTPKPTASHTPTATVSPTFLPTQTPPDTLTPIYMLYNKSGYKLSPWSFEEANNKLRQMESYSLSLSDLSTSKRELAELFLPPAIMVSEIIANYPNQITIDYYEKIAYYLAKANHPLAATYYAKLIANLLNNKITTITELAVWLQSRQKNLSFNTYSIRPPSGINEAYILHISGCGKGLFWILNTNSHYSIQPLFVEFDFTAPGDSYLLFEDINKDNFPEVILYSIPTSDFQNLSLPRVFDISNTPYKMYPFNHSINIPIGMPYQGKWLTQEDSDGKLLFVFHGTMFPSCPIFIEATFTLINNHFEMKEIYYQVAPQNGLQGYCVLVLEHAQNKWKVDQFIEIGEQLLPLWPPPPLPNGEMFSLYAKDELILKLGIAYAYKGDINKAIEYLKSLTSEDSIVKNPYVDSAQLFLTYYKKPEDVYQSCMAVFSQQLLEKTLPKNDLCFPKTALSSLFSFFLLQDQEKQKLGIVNFLLNNKVTIRASGNKDFDADGIDETWLLIFHHKNLRPELWIYYPLSNELLFIHSVNSVQLAFNEFEPKQKPPVIEVMNNNFSFQLLYEPNENMVHPIVIETNYFWDEYIYQFFNIVITQLLSYSFIPINSFNTLSSHPEFTCSKRSKECAEFFTLRAIVHERQNSNKAAFNDYYKTLINYPNSSFHYYARLKLEPVYSTTIYPLSTPSMTHTPTPSETSTITPSPTPSETPITNEETENSTND